MVNFCKGNFEFENSDYRLVASSCQIKPKFEHFQGQKKFRANVEFELHLQRLLEHGEDADIDEPITIDESQMSEFGLKGGQGMEDGGAVQQDRAPMTAEEKAAAVEALKAKIAAKRAEKAKAEEVDEVDKEKQRREMGQKSAQTMAERKEAQERAEAARAKRQKEEERAYLEKLKEQVRQEREARNAKLAGATAPVAAPVAEPAPATSSTTNAAVPEYTECQLQIRLTNGQAIKGTFLPANTIGEVAEYVSKNRTDGYGPFVLMTNFPKTVFDTAEKKNMTLLDASTYQSSHVSSFFNSLLTIHMISQNLCQEEYWLSQNSKNEKKHRSSLKQHQINVNQESRYFERNESISFSL